MAYVVQVNNTVELKFLASLPWALLMCEIKLSEKDKELNEKIGHRSSQSKAEFTLRGFP